MQYVSPSGSDSSDGSQAQPKLTIQAAIYASQSGDTVIVADGTYSGDGNRDLDFGGQDITVTSQNGATKTIIDCGGHASADGSGDHRGFYIHSGESAAVISGFTIKNGYESHDSGGGIYIESSGVTVQDCTITGNMASDSAAASTVTATRSPTVMDQFC